MIGWPSSVGSRLSLKQMQLLSKVTWVWVSARPTWFEQLTDTWSVAEQEEFRFTAPPGTTRP